MSEPFSSLYRSLDYDFTDSTLLRIALTHRSVGSINNERLEFLGDALLGFVIGEALYQRFREADEGQLTRLRASLVNRETLATIARELDLGRYLTLGEGELKTGGRSRDSILANALEAIIGAIYLDAGLDICRDRVIRIFGRVLASVSPLSIEKDPKTELQEFLQARKLELPSYEVISIEGEPHNQLFTVQCYSSALAEPIAAQGSTRRRAEQAVARKMLEKLCNASKS